MKKQLETGDRVLVELELIYDSQTNNKRAVGVNSNKTYNIDHLDIKPEFEPREMLVSDNGNSWHKAEVIYHLPQRDMPWIGKHYVYKHAEEVPKEPENGKVYQLGDVIVFKTDKRAGFGFDKNGYFKTDALISFNGPWREYPLEEFKKLLIEEVNKRGFVVGGWVDRKFFAFKNNPRIVELKSRDILITSDGRMISIGDHDIFKNGIWAEIIE